MNIKAFQRITIKYYCFFYYNIISVPPEVSEPDRSILYEPVYTDSYFNISCEAYGTDITLSLEVNSTDELEFETHAYIVHAPGMYDLESGFGSNMTWTMDPEIETCATVERYDGEIYRCVATNSDPNDQPRSVRSEAITVRTQCKKIKTCLARKNVVN